MDECSQINEEEQDWIDEQGIFGGFGRIFEGENHALYAASRHALMSFYIMNSGMPSLAGRLDFRSPIEAMRVFGNFAYLAVRPHGYVIVDVSDSGNMLEAGSHDLAWWVSGQEIEKDRVYVLDGNTLKIAMVSPEMGWIWQ